MTETVSRPPSLTDKIRAMSPGSQEIFDELPNTIHRLVNRVKAETGGVYITRSTEGGVLVVRIQGESNHGQTR